MSNDESRSYTIGLPVTITVDPDGKVTFDVDLSEADAIGEDPPFDFENNVNFYATEDIDADVKVVSEAAAKINHIIKTTVRPNAGRQS